MSNKNAVRDWRQRTKAKLVTLHGGKCVDCGYVGPPFMYDFDHRNPEEKAFGIAEKGMTYAFARQYEETLKCDLVCANCHRMRTHKQRCGGCSFCQCPMA